MAWSVPKIGALNTVASGNITLAEPAGIAVGDLMVVCIAYRSNAAFTVPGDWNLVATQQSSGDTDATNGIASGVMMWCIRGGSAPTLTFNRTAGDVAQGRIIAYTGASVTPYDTGAAATNPGASANVSVSAITTAEAGELVVAMVSCGDNLSTSAFASGADTQSGATDTTTAPTNNTWIERADTGTNTGADSGLAIADNVWSAAATKTPSATVSAAARHVMVVGAFKAAPASYTLTAETGTFSYSGAAAGLSKGYRLTAEAGTFSYAGGNAALSHAPAEPPPIVSQAGFRWYADGTETGSTALAAQNINYAPNLSGGNVMLQLRFLLQSIVAARLTAETGIFSYVGANANLFANSQVLQAGTGTFSYTGNNATLTKSTSGNIAFDAASSGTWVPAPGASIVWQHTCSGTDRILLVGVYVRDIIQSVSSITYAGAALTKIGDVPVGAGAIRLELWYRIAPATGSNTIDVDLTGTVSATLGASAVSLTGVHQTSPIGNTNSSAPDTGTSVSTSVTTSTANSWLVDAVMHRNDITINSDQTERQNTNNGSTTVGGMATRTTTTTGSYSMGWLNGADHQWRHFVVEIKST